MPYCENIEHDADNCYDCPWFNEGAFRCDRIHIDEKPSLGGRLISWVRKKAAARAAANKE